MIDEKDVQKAIQLFRCNPFWRTYYNDAPTERLKEWIGYHFLFSRNPKNRDEVIKAMEHLEEEFSIEEWEYIYDYTGNNPYKLTVRKKIEALREIEK